FLWETVKESIYPSVFFIDSKSITLNGFKGINLNEIMQTVPFDNGIVVFDEFDKLIAPTFDGKGANVSRNVQGDFLKVLDEGFAKRTQMGTFNMASTKNITFILCGSFYDKADEKAQKTVNRIGFLAKQDEERAYDKKVTLNDMIEFGMLKEIAGRVVDIMNVEPLSAEDYVAFLSGFENGGVKQIEKLYHKRISISDKAIHEIANEALHDSLGLRKAIGIIRRRVNEYIFENGADVEEISIM
ncbi:MAG: AAA family ATPase, partial [Lachnospiraceae bacterium]|nr:AAA family ATPase [Lachnospiraceae bacterium]